MTHGLSFLIRAASSSSSSSAAFSSEAFFTTFTVKDLFETRLQLPFARVVDLDACLDGAFDYDVANLRKFTSDPAFDLKRAKGVDVFSSRLLEDASYVRLARLSLSYDYAFREGCWLDSIRFTLAAKNLLTLSKYTGSAPWVNGYGFDVSRLGVDNGAYPSFKSFLLGVTLSF